MADLTAADEGLAEINAIAEELVHVPGLLQIYKRLSAAIEPVSKALNDLRLENEELTAALHRRSEGMH